MERETGGAQSRRDNGRKNRTYFIDMLKGAKQGKGVSCKDVARRWFEPRDRFD